MQNQEEMRELLEKKRDKIKKDGIFKNRKSITNKLSIIQV